MHTYKELLKDQEVLLSDFNVEIARWSNGRWNSTVPSLYVILTDHRLILQPYTRKRREPAIIPASYIVYVGTFDEVPRKGVVLSLRSGHRIAMFTPVQKHDKIVRDLRTVSMPAARRNRKFEISLDLGGLKRLIEFVAQM
ncbi:MAG: hypothetical protein ACOCYT_01125 [Chloroflexota bacterium]